MPTSLESKAGFRGRILRWLIKFWLSHISTYTWWRQLRPAAWQVVVWIASIYRLRLRRVVFIGVTGSCGKTTTKEMIAAVLSSQYKGHKSHDNANTLSGVVKSILLTRPGYSFCAQEFTVGGIGEEIPLEKQFDMFKPQMGVVTTVGDDHISALGSREAIAAEKGKLIAALPKHGTAILNADDHLVLAMQSRCQGRILTYGLSSDAMLRAEDIRDDWPNRLSLTVLYEGESVRVHTQLCGAHLVPNVLAAMAVGRAMGVSLQSAAAALEGVAPVPNRMCPIESPDGVAFICDDVKASVWAIPAALDYMRHATAKRKIVILGTLSDYLEKMKHAYTRVARQALGVTDHVFFVGPWASLSLRAKRYPEDQAVQAFVTIDHINGFLHGFLEPGDLVLIKGSLRADQLSRIVSAWTHKSQGRSGEVHSDLDRAGPPTIVTNAPTGSANDTMMDEGVSQLVVGLGNPGKRFDDTPHNVGYRTLELLAELLQARWSEEKFGVAARAHVQGRPVLLVKPATEMNHIGPWMRQLADRSKLKVQDCVIIQDDLHLKPGDVRNRMSGSSGGHKGVQSTIAAFQSEHIRRVKIGVGLPTDGTPVPQYVLTPFEPSARDTMEKACRQAATRVLDMLKLHAGHTCDSEVQVHSGS
jgi:UDP-N-acetylmuramoyl-tripeptide--D-alanyl-D-alanine ligase